MADVARTHERSELVGLALLESIEISEAVESGTAKNVHGTLHGGIHIENDRFESRSYVLRQNPKLGGPRFLAPSFVERLNERSEYLSIETRVGFEAHRLQLRLGHRYERVLPMR